MIVFIWHAVRTKVHYNSSLTLKNPFISSQDGKCITNIDPAIISTRRFLNNTSLFVQTIIACIEGQRNDVCKKSSQLKVFANTQPKAFLTIVLNLVLVERCDENILDLPFY